MERTRDRFELRISPEDRRHLRALAAAARRSESAVVRALLRATPPEALAAQAEHSTARREATGLTRQRETAAA